MPLEEYRRKRDFARTPEPAGQPHADQQPSAGGRRFVVQRHRATRLHYDFRLELDGVLVSWAVPRGPTLDPKARRMAVHVEDHPLEYFDFEGVIPPKQYGAGDVIVWDWGTWQAEAPTADPGPALAAGELKFVLHGEKLRGRFTIVRTSGRTASGKPGEQEQWLLIHKTDDFAVAGWDAADHPLSVKSGRTNDEVKAAAPAIWVSEAPLSEAQIDLSAARTAPMPEFVEPMTATLTSRAFSDDDWLFEVKWDGYRVEAVVADGTTRLFTRHRNDADTYFPGLLSPPDWIAAEQAIVDGEVVALDEAGRPDFGLLQERITSFKAGRGVGLVYQAFDLLYLDGRTLLDVPLEERKKLLRLVLREHPRVRFAGHVLGQGLDFFAAAQANELEGIVAKQRRSRYQPGRRTATWLKVKIRPEQEFVVGGWTPATGNPRELGALVVGVYVDGELRYAGKIGSGFDERARRGLMSSIEPLAIAEPPFGQVPPKQARGRWGGDLAGVTWLRPALVIRAQLGGWTREGLVRQASFKGIEQGKDPRDVVRERAVSPQLRQPDADPPAVAVVPGPTGETGRGPGAPAAVTAAELAILAALPTDATWEVGGQALKLTNLEKVLFPPAPGEPEPITKRELIAYFARIAPAMLPHLADRPLNLHRYPNGSQAPGFWQKDIPRSAPKWLTIWHETGFREREDRQPNDHLIADRVATLAWLANQAAFEVHAWTATRSDPWKPTFALVDIDPGPRTTWDETLTLARLYRTAFGHLGVTAYPKTTGSRGIQAWIPVTRGKYDYSATSAWVEALSRAIGATVPDLVSWVWSTRDREGKARLDYTQNAPIKTLVAPYAVRPRPGAPVSMPITWEELDDPELRSDRWTIRTAPQRVAEIGDLFAGAQVLDQDLPSLG